MMRWKPASARTAARGLKTAAADSYGALRNARLSASCQLTRPGMRTRPSRIRRAVASAMAVTGSSPMAAPIKRNAASCTPSAPGIRKAALLTAWIVDSKMTASTKSMGCPKAQRAA